LRELSSKRSFELQEINYAKTGLDEATVLAIVAGAGSVAAVLNTRHATAKAKGWVDSPPSAAAFARVVAGDRAIVGVDPAAYATLGRR
jgi:arsenate reductase-like glutaredoxin family protein